MGTLTFSTNKDGQSPISYSATIADVDLDSFIVVYAAHYFPEGVVVTPADGETPAVTRAPTLQEIVTAIAQGLADGMAGFVVQALQAKAKAKAAATVATITITSGKGT